MDKKCFIKIDGTEYYFPCYPEKFTDTRQANYTSQNPLGRSEPFQIYQNSGPRTVSVSFRMHREMLNDDILASKQNHIDILVCAIQSATYPMAYGSHIPPRVQLVLGDSCSITGVIEGSVSAEWGETIVESYLDDSRLSDPRLGEERYQVVDLSFSVTEVTGNPITSNMTSRIFGY